MTDNTTNDPRDSSAAHDDLDSPAAEASVPMRRPRQRRPDADVTTSYNQPDALAAMTRTDRRQTLIAPSDEAHRTQPQRKRRRTPLIVALAVVITVIILAVVASAFFRPQAGQLLSIFESNDYDGPGHGDVTVQILNGHTGSDVAQTLHTSGVVKTADSFYQLLLEQADEEVFTPGAYALRFEMSSAEALDALRDDANRLENGFVIPEGTSVNDVYDIISAGLAMDRDAIERAGRDPQRFGVPEEANDLEGFLFPATYTFDVGTEPEAVLTRLVERSFESLDAAGVAEDDRWRTVILASIVQREAGLAEDYPRVARVFLNRLDPETWPSQVLQSDATVHYGVDRMDNVETTPEERADESNPYNTYANPGLPVGPISNPGDIAIDAVVNPAEGDWLYFVTWNLDSGETAFSTTFEEHEVAVARWREWMAENR